MVSKTLTIHNGEKTPAIFSKTEMAGRLAKLRKLMAASGMDAVLFTSFHNINYYNHFVYCAFGRPYGLVVTQEP